MAIPASITVPERDDTVYDLRRPTAIFYARADRTGDFAVAWEVTYDREVSAGVYEECPPEYRSRGSATVPAADLADTLAELDSLLAALPPA